MEPKESKKTTKCRQKSTAKALRNQKIVADVMAGKTQRSIAAEMGLAPDTVSRIMNAEEMREAVEVGRAKIHAMIPKFLNGLEYIVDQITDPMTTGHAKTVCLEGLKSVGILTSKVDLTATFPAVTVVTRPNGDHVIIGAKNGKEE